MFASSCLMLRKKWKLKLKMENKMDANDTQRVSIKFVQLVLWFWVDEGMVENIQPQCYMNVFLDDFDDYFC